MNVRGTVCIHIGTHKTGTKALQVFLSENQRPLDEHGILFPRAGHLTDDPKHTPGHHLIPREFLTLGHSPSFEELVGEIDARGPVVAVVSSENFQYFADRPETLHTIREAFARIGYRVHIVVYLRLQSRYSESLYVEYAKHGTVAASFDRYLEAILSSGEISLPGRIDIPHLDYRELLLPFTTVFGREHMNVRPYRTDRGLEHIFVDFLAVVARLRGEVRMKGLLVKNAGQNFSITLDTFLTLIRRSASVPSGAASPETLVAERFPNLDNGVLQSRFSPLLYHEEQQIIERFAESNAEIERTYETEIPHSRRSQLVPPSEPHWQTAHAQREVLRYVFEAWGIQ